jgi:peptide/nickel transport system ATP-binding protein
MTDAIDVKDLTITFGTGARQVVAVQDASFTVTEGESFGLVGESGSGKSTILRAIVGLVSGWTGQMTVAGEPLGHKRSKAFYSKAQMVFQDPYASLHPRQTVDRVLSEAMQLHGITDIDTRLPRLLEDVGLGPSFRFRYPHQLSGGQRQRVAIARALACDPKILLLDEPTSALDVSVQAEILNLLADLQKDHGLTYVMVSHDLGVVGHLCDRIGVMQYGRIVEELGVAQMRRMEAQDPYTKSLLRASTLSTNVDSPAA